MSTSKTSRLVSANETEGIAGGGVGTTSLLPVLLHLVAKPSLVTNGSGNMTLHDQTIGGKLSRCDCTRWPTVSYRGGFTSKRIRSKSKRNMR